MVEEKSLLSSIDTPSNIYTINYYIKNQTSINKTIQLAYPCTDEKIIKSAPSVSTYDENNYRYTFSSWSITRNDSSRIITVKAVYSSTALYTWKKYKCTSTTFYQWKKYTIKTGTYTYINDPYCTSFVVPRDYGFAIDGFVGRQLSNTVYNGQPVLNLTSMTNGSTIQIWNTSSTYNQTNFYARTIRSIVMDPEDSSIDCAYVWVSDTYEGKFDTLYNIYASAKTTSSITNNGVFVSISKITAGGRGNFIEDVESTSLSAYPANEKQNGYWYTSNGSRIEYSIGSYITTVNSTSSTTYPDNGKHTDGYWYIKQ